MSTNLKLVQFALGRLEIGLLWYSPYLNVCIEDSSAHTSVLLFLLSILTANAYLINFCSSEYSAGLVLLLLNLKPNKFRNLGGGVFRNHLFEKCYVLFFDSRCFFRGANSNISLFLNVSIKYNKILLYFINFGLKAKN